MTYFAFAAHQSSRQPDGYQDASPGGVSRVVNRATARRLDGANNDSDTAQGADD